MGWGLQRPLAASATRASSLIAGPEPAQSLSLLHSPSTLVYNKTKLSYYILDTDPQPSAALKALPASARKTLRVSPPRHGGYAASHRLRNGMGPMAPSCGWRRKTCTHSWKLAIPASISPENLDRTTNTYLTRASLDLYIEKRQTFKMSWLWN